MAGVTGTVTYGTDESSAIKAHGASLKRSRTDQHTLAPPLFSEARKGHGGNQAYLQ